MCLLNSELHCDKNDKDIYDTNSYKDDGSTYSVY